MPSPAGRYVTLADIQDRLSATTVRRIYDDDNNGTPDDSPIQRLINDQEAVLTGFVATEHDMGTIPTSPTSQHPLLKKLALDLIEGAAFVRHPEYGRKDGQAILDRAMADLKLLANGSMTLDGIQPRAANVGVVVLPDDQDLTEPKRFWDSTGGTGIF